LHGSFRGLKAGEKNFPSFLPLALENLILDCEGAGLLLAIFHLA
jgi:hypothetical protein